MIEQNQRKSRSMCAGLKPWWEGEVEFLYFLGENPRNVAVKNKDGDQEGTHKL